MAEDIRHQIHVAGREGWNKMSVDERKDILLRAFAEFVEDCGDVGGCPVRAEEHCYNRAGEPDENDEWRLFNEGGCQQCLQDRLCDTGAWA